MPVWLSDQWTRDWLESEPPLSDIDLRPYFYFSRDTLGQIGMLMPRLSPVAQQVLTELFDKSEALRNNALKKAKELNPDEAVAVFRMLSEKARQEEDPTDDRSALQRCFDWGKTRSDLRNQLFTFLDGLPFSLIPVNAVMKLLDLRESMEDKRNTRRLVEKWAGQSENAKLKQIAQSRLPEFTD